MRPGDNKQISKRQFDNGKNEEKLGRFVVIIGYLFFALRFILIASAIALAVVLIMGKPLWIAPVAGVVMFAIWRVFWRLFWRFIHWSNK